MEIKKGEESGHLERGAVGIGESHDSPGGRLLVIELIKSGKVKKLLVELSPGAYDGAVNGAKDRQKDGVDSITKTLDLSLGTRHKCDISLGRVIAEAICANIPVYNVDHYKANQRAEMAASVGVMKIRNEEVAKQFEKITGSKAAVSEGAKGCLLLFGGAHFEDANAIDADANIFGLPVVMMG